MAYLFRQRIVRYYSGGKRITAKQARRLRSRGKPVERRVELSRKWYIRYRLPDGRLRTTAGYTDKSATKALALRLEREAAREAAGLLQPADKHAGDAVEAHLVEFRADLELRGRTAKHVALTVQRIGRLFGEAGVRRLVDIEPNRLLDALRRLRESGLSLESSNHYLVAAKIFSRWLWRQQRLAADPLAGLRRSNADVDRRVVRRALSGLELRQLVDAAERSAWSFRGLTGTDRAALYVAAAFTGLRAAELASLTAADLRLDADPPVVAVQAAYSKNRRQDVLPLPQYAASYLAGWLARRAARPVGEARLWPGTWHLRAAAMLRRDLVAAGIPAEQDGQRLDFHCLRSTYATMLARQGVNLQTAQALLRHSDPKLTAATYTKLGITDLSVAVRELGLPASEAPAAVGTRRP